MTHRIYDMTQLIRETWRNSYMWHYCLNIYLIPCSNVWYDSIHIRETWLILMCDMTHWYVWHDSLICVTLLIDMCEMTHLLIRYYNVYLGDKLITHTVSHCNTLHHTATHCNTLQHTWHDSFTYQVLQSVAEGAAAAYAQIEFKRECAAVRGSVLQCVAVCGSVLQCVAVCCSVLQCIAAYA